MSKLKVLGIVQGPRGLPGPKGDPGDVGALPTDPTFNTITVTNTSQLTGQVNVGDAGLHVTGDVNALADVSVTGQVTVGSAGVPAALDVFGPTQLSGALSVLSPYVITGSVTSTMSLSSPTAGYFVLPLSPHPIYVQYGLVSFSGIGESSGVVQLGSVNFATRFPNAILSVVASIQATTDGRPILSGYTTSSTSTESSVIFSVSNTKTLTDAAGNIQYVAYGY